MEELKEKIKQLIAPNGKNAITAQVLQSVLLELVDELNDNQRQQLQEQGDSITANTSAIEDLNSQIGDIDAILTEIIGGE